MTIWFAQLASSVTIAVTFCVIGRIESAAWRTFAIFGGLMLLQKLYISRFPRGEGQ
jgi:hypothetical protein